MKLKIILTLMMAFGLTFQSCEKDEDKLSSPNSIDQQHVVVKKEANKPNKSGSNFIYYQSGSNEFIEKKQYLEETLNLSNSLIVSEIELNNSLLVVDLHDKGEVNLFKINGKHIAFKTEGDEFIFIDTSTTSVGTNYMFSNNQDINIGNLNSYDEIPSESDTVFYYSHSGTELSPRARLIIQCVKDHWSDICGDSFFVSVLCTVGCAGCPECCLGASVIFGIDCYNQLSVSGS